MRSLLLLAGMLFLFQNSVHAQDSLQATIVLIGDAGQLTNGKQPVVHSVQQHIPLDSKTTVIYLGDNLYKTGLPDDAMPTYEIAKAPLDSQITIAGNKKVNVYFIPGNHDWANGTSIGYASILRVQSYIDLLGNKYVQSLPRDGCPGPVEIKITDDVTLVIMDSQWWLQEKEKPGIESDCSSKTKAEVLTQLDDILVRNSKKLVVLACHHPLRSYGPHGGYFTLKQHIFPFTDAVPNLYIPLPVLGSAYPLTRAVFGTAQDLKHPLYQDMIHSIENVVRSHPNVIFVSGHEHTLQMIQDSGYNYIVSGSGSKTNRVSKGKNALYVASKNGYATLQISRNKTVTANFYTVDGDSTSKEFSQHILDFSRIPEEKADTIRAKPYVFKDTAVISASDKYRNYTGFKKFFLGKNYREEWSKPVEFKEFNLNKTHGGFTIKSLGGGKQTKSLKLEDKDGKEWSLRTVDKDPEKALPLNLRGTLAQRIVQDMISASYPYAPLVVPTLAKAVGVLAAQPEFFFVPDDPAFGQYQKLFANTVVMLEDRDPTPDGSQTKSSDKILNKMFEDNDHHVDQEAVLKARLLDMLIGDWDRHPDQWKWGTGDTGKGKLYYPVPRDRDQAFFNSDGFLVKFLSRKQMQFLQGFKKNIPNIDGLNYVARDFDRLFLTSLDKKSFEATADTFQRQITDAVIVAAAQKLPPEILQLDSAMIVDRLISRRNLLKKNALHYYKFLSREVNVPGSNKPEFFHVENDNGDLRLSVYKKNNEQDSVTLMFRRTFKYKYTKELNLFGLNGNDKFVIDPDVSSKIKMHIVGGKGEDMYDLRGNIKNKTYDLSTEKNTYLNLRRTDKETSSDPSIIAYHTNDYEYNKFLFPQINLGYNAEDKILFGFGFNSRKYGFRKDPYKSDQKLITLFAPNRVAFQAKYRAVFNTLILKNDLIINAEYLSPTLNNFFGYGNRSKYDKSKGLDFYRVRFKYLQTDVLLRRRYNDIFQLSAGPTYYHYASDFNDNKTRILNTPAVIGRDSSSVYSNKDYVGVKLKFDISYINNELFPSRGITWFTELSSVKGLNDNSHGITKLTSDMTVYATVSDASKVTAVLRAGGGKILNGEPEYFQTLTLGANNYVRGYRKNRFSGTSMLYGSGEVRFKLFKSNSLLFPGDVGVLGYYDIGRVWYAGENSGKWHDAAGGGLYFVPYNILMISATIGISEEDRLFNFTVGTKFNLTF